MISRAPLPAISLAVVGADFPNKKGPGRRFEIALCKPGEPVSLIPEPRNPADPRAIAVHSERGVQIGYVTAERASWIGKLLRETDVVAVFQHAAPFGAVIRVAFDGSAPVLPARAEPTEIEGNDEFWPDEVWPDD